MVKRDKILILIGAVLFCLIVFGILARLNLISPPQTDSNGWYIEQWKISPVNYFANNTLFKLNPSLGLVIKPNLKNYKLVYADPKVYNKYSKVTTSYISTDSQGFRGTQNYTIQKGNKTRIWVLGDSYTFGQCLNDSETFPSYLQNIYNNSEVINTGVPGWGFDQQLLELEQVGLKYKPDVILVGFFGDDINRDGLSFMVWEKPEFMLNKGKLKLTNFPVPDGKFIESPFYPRIINYVSALKDLMFYKRKQMETYNVTYRIFQRMQADAKSINSTLILVYLPYSQEAINNETPNPLYTYICDNLNISCIDSIPYINQILQNKTNPYNSFSCHYSKQIQNTIAKTIYDSIKNYSIPELKKVQLQDLPNKTYTSEDLSKYEKSISP